MKLKRQKQQEALNRRESNLVAYKSLSVSDTFPSDWKSVPETVEGRKEFLSRKITVCEEDIAKLRLLLD